jgi:hypothetical protein
VRGVRGHHRLDRRLPRRDGRRVLRGHSRELSRIHHRAQGEPKTRREALPRRMPPLPPAL